jgi:HPt (histidine-containing phosphotransfer) domain-containing protein
MKGDRERCLDAGMDGYVTKPIQPRELWQAIAAVLSDAAAGGPPPPPAPERAAGPEAEAAFDREGLLARVGGSVEVARTVAGVFEGEWPRLRDAVRDALARADAAALGRAAHSLKGTLGSLGAVASLETARRLEGMARAAALGQAAAAARVLEGQVAQLQAALAGL